MLGGSGAVGSRVARSLRRLQPDLPIVIAARDAAKIFGGLGTLAALHLAKELKAVDVIALAGIVDPHGGAGGDPRRGRRRSSG
ncbi:hypothetical protein WMF04_18155 [Sorangium sp. So ce260]|uniref:hypothetical protein n=1 Tax=Sorangium sp. So ce260 TaxID=3133291 RepID=UPI003F61CDE7